MQFWIGRAWLLHLNHSNIHVYDFFFKIHTVIQSVFLFWIFVFTYLVKVTQCL